VVHPCKCIAMRSLNSNNKITHISHIVHAFIFVIEVKIGNHIHNLGVHFMQVNITKLRAKRTTLRCSQFDPNVIKITRFQSRLYKRQCFWTLYFFVNDFEKNFVVNSLDVRFNHPSTMLELHSNLIKTTMATSTMRTVLENRFVDRRKN